MAREAPSRGGWFVGVSLGLPCPSRLFWSVSDAEVDNAREGS
jgi:hypothetical protein